MSENNILNDQQNLDLNNLIKANNTDDNTEEIRRKKVSTLIRNDIKQFLFLKNKYNRLQKSNTNEFDKIITNQCSFLFNNYTSIFNKLKNNTLNLEILDKFLIILKKIEDNEVNQHEGSFLVGKYLKELYIDSALTETKMREEKNNYKKTKKKPPEIQEKKISFKEFKNMNISN
tara:strand:- start:44 stop:565 length:522 start_codon:yes stop_codon:yes gene_type:complete